MQGSQPRKHEPRARATTRAKAQRRHRTIVIKGKSKGADPPLEYRLLHGDTVARLAEIPDASIDAVVSDPPYPCVNRSYGKLTEAAWATMMDAVVGHTRRVLKPRGSAVFVLQPNCSRVGTMRTWLWDFMAKWGREWNQVQDAWWWNHSSPPTGHSKRTVGLMRPSVKACVWLGPPDCWRDQEAVLWTPSEATLATKASDRCERKVMPSGFSINAHRMRELVIERGGVTPFNLLPIRGHSETHGHPAATPRRLASWWVSYLCPPGGRVLDPFNGSGTMMLAAMEAGRSATGVEQHAKYIRLAERRLLARRQELAAA